MADLGAKGERNELIQSGKSKFFFATRFQKPKQKDVRSKRWAGSSSAFMLTPAISLTSFVQTDSRTTTAVGGVETTPWPNVKEYYDLLEIVGVGTTAQVYAAFCIPRKEKCAIKLVDLTKWKSGLENLLKDVQAMTAINHPNLVTYYTAFAERDELWLVLQYMEHQSLLSVIRRKLRSVNCTHGVFDEQTIATILTSVLSGLEFIHNNGYIHRDVKAENILLDANGQVKIADFSTTTCTARFQSFVGSPCWLAPEIIADPDHTYTSKADVWSLGITAIEMATGFPPHHKRPTMKVLMSILLHDSPSLETDAEVRDQYKAYGRTFRSFINSCLEKNPSERPSVKELLFHPFFKKTRDNDYLKQVLAAVPPDTETRFRKPFVKLESSFKAPRGEWILDEALKQVEPSNADPRRDTPVTYDSEKASDKTSVSIKTKSSGGKGTSRILTFPRAVTHVYDFILKIRGLNLDSPMIMKTAVFKNINKLGLAGRYKDQDDEIGIWLHHAFEFPLVNPDEVSDLFCEWILRRPSDQDKKLTDNFIEYLYRRL